MDHMGLRLDHYNQMALLVSFLVVHQLLAYVVLRSFDSSEWIAICFENILFVFLVNECACGIIFFTVDSCVNLFCCARDSYAYGG